MIKVLLLVCIAQGNTMQFVRYEPYDSADACFRAAKVMNVNHDDGGLMGSCIYNGIDE